MDRFFAFDLWGQYAHYKKIFATTTALTYPIPVKTSLYGMFAAILGLEKKNNRYLEAFQDGDCKVGIQVINPIAFQQININLRAVFGAMKPNNNRKPTMMEFVYRPRYRVFFTHSDSGIYASLSRKIQHKEAFYTPTLGLANLFANYQWLGEFPLNKIKKDDFLPIISAIPREKLLKIDHSLAFSAKGNRIVETSQYAMEMDVNRNVIKRDDLIFDQKGQLIYAKVKEATLIKIEKKEQYVVFF